MSRGLRHGAPPVRRRREHPLGREPEGDSPRFATRIAGLAVTSSGTWRSQAEMLELLGLADDEFAIQIFDRCGVERRRLALTPDEIATGLRERAQQTEEGLVELALDAIRQLDFEPSEIGTVITASYYSLGGPTLAHRLVHELDLDPATDKYHVLGIGCASAVPLFRLASQTLLEDPGSRALVVGAERLSGLMTAVRPGDERTKIVGSALFGDGAGAALLTRDAAAPGPALLAAKVHQIEDTLAAVRFVHAEHDSYIHIGRELPSFAREALGGLVDDFLADRGLTRDRIGHWIVHPGGRGIIEGVQDGLGLSREQVEASYEVLANHGNVGSPSAFYVLAEVIERNDPQPGDLGLAVTIGPGVTVGLMLLRW